MAGITDIPFRIICREMGAGFTVSEMVSAKGIIYNNAKTFTLLAIDEQERPTAIQLFGSEPREMAKAAKVAENAGADIIDVNMGCPVPKIVNNGDGSALMRNPELTYEILARMAEAVTIPVTVKFRSGWNEKNINAVEIAMKAEKAGVAAVAVHARTREQFYSGRADWSVIKAVKEAVRIPGFGNAAW
jgi:tRNA-dihydrouridine synthase B